MKYGVSTKVYVESHPEYRGLRGRVVDINHTVGAQAPYSVKVFAGTGVRYLWLSEAEFTISDIWYCGTCMGAWSPDIKECPDCHKMNQEKVDRVNSPSHYTWLPKGLEVIDLTEHLNFNRGNAVKYLCRAGRKDSGTELEDLEKARWYVVREIQRVKAEAK